MTPSPVETQWCIPEPDYPAFRSFCSKHDLQGVLAELLFAKNMQTSGDLHSFLHPASNPLADPFGLTDMDKAVERLHAAHEKQEHVRIIGDYDVDGISATALMVRGLRALGIENVSYALPDRLEDGYGLNNALLESALRDSVSLVITVDNGIMAHESATFAHENNLDLIITDHHSIGDTLPEACAVLNPKRDAPDAPLANICGAAMAFQLCTALNKSPQNLALVALATIADVMPLHGENRTLTHLGLQEIQQGEQPGIQALLRKAKIQSKRLRAEDIAFQIAPRINASGRLSSGGNALDLLLTDDPDEADYLASQLNMINEDRKEVEREITRSALEMLEDYDLDSKRCIVLANDDWHPGVIGIVASKLQHQFQKPVALIALDENGVGRSSARSNDTFSLINAFQNCDHLFVKFGGHRNAAGMTIERANIPAFQEAMEAEAVDQSTSTRPVKSIHINAILPFTTVDNELLGDIDRFEPMGHANPSPVFATFGVKPVPGSARALKGGHLQCTFEHDKQTFRAIGFNMADRFDPGNLPSKVDIAYIPKFNHWQGNTTIQLHLVDIKDSKNNSISHESA